MPEARNLAYFAYAAWEITSLADNTLQSQSGISCESDLVALNICICQACTSYNRFPTTGLLNKLTSGQYLYKCTVPSTRQVSTNDECH
jgi:hypothetical protein